MFGPDYTFLGVPACDWSEPATYADADVVIVGAPFDGGTSHRPGARFGPQVIRGTDYLPHDGSRPHMAMRVDALTGVRDAGDLEVYSGEIERSCRTIEDAVAFIAAHGAIPLILGGDHTVTWPDVAGVARAPRRRPHLGHPLRRARRHRRHRVRLPLRPRPADAPADRVGRGPRRPLPAARPARLLARPRRPGLDGRPGHELVPHERDRRPRPGRGAWTKPFAIAMDDCDGVFLSVDIDVCDPGHAPGTGTPEPGGLTARQLLDSVSRICHELPVVGMDIVEVSPPFDHAEITAMLGNRVVLEALVRHGPPPQRRQRPAVEPGNPSAQEPRHPPRPATPLADTAEVRAKSAPPTRRLRPSAHRSPANQPRRDHRAQRDQTAPAVGHQAPPITRHCAKRGTAT